MDIFTRVMERLHSVFNKEPQAAPAFRVRNTSFYPCRIEITARQITVEIGPTKQVIAVTTTITLNDLATALTSSDMQVVFDDASKGSRLVIGLPERVYELEPDYNNRYLFLEDGTVWQLENGQPLEREA